MRDYIWVSIDAALAIHNEQIAEHGGGDGVRDLALLESAMARPRNLLAYGEPGIPDLAAAYAFGIASNHPFIDGNKRSAAVVSEVFLLLNGHALDASDAEIVVAFVALAAGELSEDELTAWFGAHIVAGTDTQS